MREFIIIAGENLISESESCSNETTTPLIIGVIIGVIGIIMSVAGGSGLIIAIVIVKNQR